MNYENPHIPEEINTDRTEHPLKEFSILLIATVVLVVTGSFVVGFGGSWLAGKIPFSAETTIADMYSFDEEQDDTEDHPQIVQYLQKLTDNISKVQNLPAEMKIVVHYIDDDTMNAFATLGGHIFMYRGLLEKISSENALATLLAHEIAHVKYRHPIKSLGRGIVVSIAMTAITGSTDADIMGEAGLLTVLNFSREMEQQSDQEAMASLHKIYGHLNGGPDLYKILQTMRKDMDTSEPFEIFSTHPLDEHRIANFSTIATKNGWQQEGPLTPLPDFYRNAVKATEL